MRGWVAFLLSIAVASAGCLGANMDGEDQQTPASGAQLPSGTPTAEELAQRTLEQPPTLRLGEWWNVTVQSDLDGESYSGTVVVAGVQDGQYMLGMPAQAFSHDLLILHMPGLGGVSVDRFAYEAHDILFEPLAFPLEPGQTWSAAWYNGPVDAEVVDVTGGVAEVEMVGENAHINLTYDPALGLPARMSIDAYATMEVTDHGYGHQGTVQVPWARDLVILNGRVGPALDTALMPGAPVESVDVEGDYTHMSLAVVLGNLLVQGPPGAYRAQATAPDGTAYENTFVAGQDGEVEIQTHGHEDPTGTWQLEFEAGGPGVAAVEAVAYTLIEVPLGG